MYLFLPFPKTYDRARALIADISRGCFVFSNEHHSGTFIERQPSESPNDRNDRAIRKAAWWYSTHLPANAPPVILITNDQGNKQKAESENIRVRFAFASLDFLDSIV